MIKRYGEIACDLGQVAVVSANSDKSTVLLVVPAGNSGRGEQVVIDCSYCAAIALLKAIDEKNAA